MQAIPYGIARLHPQYSLSTGWPFGPWRAWGHFEGTKGSIAVFSQMKCRPETRLLEEAGFLTYLTLLVNCYVAFLIES